MSSTSPLCISALCAKKPDEERSVATHPKLHMCGPCAKEHRKQTRATQQRIRRAAAKAAKEAAKAAEEDKEQEAKEGTSEAQRPATAPQRRESLSIQRSAHLMRETTTQVAYQIQSVATTVAANVSLERKTMNMADGTSTIIEVR